MPSGHEILTKHLPPQSCTSQFPSVGNNRVAEVQAEDAIIHKCQLILDCEMM